MKTVLKNLLILTALMAVVAAAVPAAACTGIRIKSEDGGVVYARTLEFAADLQSQVLAVPRNMAFTGTAPNNRVGIRWKTKYGVVGANAFQIPQIADGLNEKGLGAGIFFMPNYAQYQTVDEKQTDRVLAPWELPLYLLGNCATVKEAVAAARSVRVADVGPMVPNFNPTFHYALHDASGQSAVLEYVDGQLKVHDNPLGVVTNAPTFDWHLTNLSNYVNLTAQSARPEDLSGIKVSTLGQGSGMLGLPGDFTPPSRFVRAVAFTQSALPAETAFDGVLQAFHLLNQFDIPKGAAREKMNGQTVSDYTMWTAASDLTNHRYYFHTFDNRRIRMIDMNKLDLNADSIKTFSMDQKEDVEDLTNKPM